MKKTILFTCLTALLAACSGKSAVTAPDETTVQPVNLILDTDLGSDYDDVGAMALMHALADSGQVNIFGIHPVYDTAYVHFHGAYGESSAPVLSERNPQRGFLRADPDAPGSPGHVY